MQFLPHCIASKIMTYSCCMASSAGIVRGYVLDCQGSIPNKCKRFGTTHLYLVPRSRMVELYLHSRIRLHDVVFN
jgi:hypothetical protein